MSRAPEPDLTWAVERCKAGDGESFRVIADNHAERLVRLAYLIVNDRQLAEDLVQETLAAAWKDIPTIRRGARLGAWLNRILINRIKMHHRRARHPEISIEAAAQTPDPARSPEHQALDAELSGHLWSRLTELPEEQRIAVVLRFYGGYTVPEIARSTGWRQGTIKSRLYRAMRSLRESVDSELAGRRSGGESGT